MGKKYPNRTQQKRNRRAKSEKTLAQRIFTRKRILEIVLEVILAGGGEMLGHISPYLKAGAWLTAILILIYFEIPFRRWISKILVGRYASVVSKRKTMKLLEVCPTLIIGIFLFVFAYSPIVTLMTPKPVQITQTIQQSNSELPPFVNGKQEITVSYDHFTFVRRISDLMNKPQSLNVGEYKLVNIYIDNHTIYIDTTLYGGDKLPEIQFKQNILVSEPTNWDYNSDGNAIEIVNDKQEPILQIIYKTYYDIVINGYLSFPNGYIFANEDGQLYSEGLVPKLTSNVPLTFSIKRIFEYPSSKYQGVREVTK